MAVNAIEHLDRHAEKPAASHLSTPACMSHVAAVWRSVCGLTSRVRPARRTADLKAVFTERTGCMFQSTR